MAALSLPRHRIRLRIYSSPQSRKTRNFILILFGQHVSGAFEDTAIAKIWNIAVGLEGCSG